MRIQIKGTIIPDDYKDIYDWFKIQNTCPSDVKKALAEEQDDETVFEINSGGGAIFAGSEIYTDIRSFDGKKKIEVVGMAGSAASVIACAAESYISPTAMMMIHNVSGCAYGDNNVFYHEAEVLSECNKAIAAAYMEKTGKSEEELLALMSEETWMGAKKAVERGFIDKIMPASKGLYNAMCTILTPSQIAEAKEGISARRAIEQENINLLRMRRF